MAYSVIKDNQKGEKSKKLEHSWRTKPITLRLDKEEYEKLGKYLSERRF
jgi:hypothetical protein